MAVSGMAEANAVALTFLIVVAVGAGSVFSEGSWYCHRLVPQVITHRVTPCTYPCLVVSRHEHPHIVVRNEPDGTQCMVPTGLHHEREFGTCQTGICTQDFSHKVLKRKKRFICLYTIGRIFKLKKDRRRLQNKIDELQEQLARSRLRDAENEPGSEVDDIGTGSLGVGNIGPQNGEDFSPGHTGAARSGTRDRNFPGSRRGTSAFDSMGSPGFEDSSSAGTDSGTRGYMPNRNHDRGMVGNGAFGAGADVLSGQVRIPGLASGGMPVEAGNGFNEDELIASSNDVRSGDLTLHE